MVIISLLKYLGGGNSLEINGHSTNCRFSIEGKNNKITIQKEVELTDCDIVCIGDNNRIDIGKGTTIGGANIICMGITTFIKIGSDCMLSSNIDIFNSDTHQILCGNKVANENKSIKIGNHVWIGKNVSVLKGVTIGDNSIVGIRSVVTKNISEGTIAVGNPAREVNRNITWSRERVM